MTDLPRSSGAPSTVEETTGEGWTATTDAARPRLHVEIHLRWGDLDALGHVNNTSMLKLLEEARLRAFWKGDGAGAAPPTAVFEMDVLESGGSRATLVARQEIEYLRPVPYGQRPLDVQLWIGRMGGSSADICYEVYSPSGDSPPVLYARATAVVVIVDTETGRPTRWSTAERAAWTPFLSAPIDYRRGSAS